MKKQILILGAGYAGLFAALRLWKQTRKLPVQITLVNEGPNFIERVRNHQVAASLPVATHAIRSLIGKTDLRFLQARALDILPEDRQVRLKSGDQVIEQPYDYLVYALGSRASDGGVPGVREHAFWLDAGSAHSFAARLKEIDSQQGRLLIVGGGHSGVEAATEIAETHPDIRITLATKRSFAHNLSHKGAAHARMVLKKMRIRHLENTIVTRMESNLAHTASGKALEFDLCLWAGGFEVQPLASDAGIRVNAAGQILVDPALRSISHPDIYAVGDAAMPAQDPGAPIRFALYTAIMMAAHGADALAARLRGKKIHPFGISFIAYGVSFGRGDGVVQFTTARDVPLEFILAGRIAAGVREFFVRLALTLIRTARWLPPVFFYWPGKYKNLFHRKAGAEGRGRMEPSQNVRI